MKKKPVKKPVKKKPVKKAVKKKPVKKVVKKVKKAVKKAAKKQPLISVAQKKRINDTIVRIESQLLDNYKRIAQMSGMDWKKERVKYEKLARQESKKARARIEAEVKKNPGRSAAVAAAVTAAAGALIISMLRKK